MPEAPAYIHSRWSRRALLKEAEHRGRPVRQLAGSYVDDLASLGKAITLCFSCERKFNAKSYEYRGPVKVAGIRYVLSGCDGCRTPHVKCSLYLSEKPR